MHDQAPQNTPEPYERTVSLLRAARAGDSDARERLFTRYLPRVRQIVALHLEPRNEAHLRNWLARCVENQVIDHVRGLNRQKRGGGEVRRFSDLDTGILCSSLLDAGVATPSEHAVASELAERFEEALLSMTPHHRELVILRAVCGMSFQEAADELGVASAGAVRVAYFRALRRLEELVRSP